MKLSYFSRKGMYIEPRT